MVDLREQFRPLVDRPATPPLPVAEVATRAAARRRARRRVQGVVLAGGALAAVGIAVVLGVGPGGPLVSTIAPAAPAPTVVTSAATTPTTSTPTTTTGTPTTSPAPPGTATPTTADATATTSAPATSPTTEPSSDVVATTITTTSSWETGRCVEIRVDNVSGAPVVWHVRYDPGGTVTDLWNARPDADGTTFRGASWNERLEPGARTTFGMCVSTV